MADAIVLFIFIAFGYFSRNWIIENPSFCVFDETHFGNFTNSYNQRTFFFDIHPPLAKLWLAFITKMQGYNATTVFNHSTYYDNHYVDLRFAVSSFSSLVPSLSFLTLRFIGVDIYLCSLSAMFLTAEPMLIIEGSLILTDGILHCFTLFAILSVAYLVGHTNIYSIIISSFLIGCSFSVKYTAGGLTVFIAFQQFFQICDGNIFDLFKFPDKNNFTNDFTVFGYFYNYLNQKQSQNQRKEHETSSSSSEFSYSSSNDNNNKLEFNKKDSKNNKIYEYNDKKYTNNKKKSFYQYFYLFFQTKFWELCMRGIVIGFFCVSVLIISFAAHVIIIKYREYTINEISNEYEESLLWNWEKDHSRHVKQMGLLKRIYISIFRMQQINNMCTKAGGFESYWKQWPIININILLYAQPPPGFILMLPNPITWISALLGPIFLTSFILIFGFKQRHLWKNIIWPIGYAVSLFPFILVPRTTYVYHYLISLIFGVLSFSVFLHILFSGKYQHIFNSFTLLFIIVSFILLFYYLPITSAMSGYSIKTKPWKESLFTIYNRNEPIL